MALPSLSPISFRVELIENLLDKDINKAKAELTELKSLVRSSIQDIRKLSMISSHVSR